MHGATERTANRTRRTPGGKEQEKRLTLGEGVEDGVVLVEQLERVLARHVLETQDAVARAARLRALTDRH